MATVDLVIETGKKRSFASALDWPGWARSTSSHDDVLETLERYRARYAAVLAASSLPTPVGRLTVREELVGDATTDFGAPSQIAERDHRALRAPDRERLASILVACWSRFDEVASSAGELRTGPRGGGRQVEAMRRHVTDAEVAYARGLGLRVSSTNGEHAAIASLRERIAGVVEGTAAPEREGKWPLRYGIRRIAWHVCDHLFEIEDRER